MRTSSHELQMPKESRDTKGHTLAFLQLWPFPASGQWHCYTTATLRQSAKKTWVFQPLATSFTCRTYIQQIWLNFLIREISVLSGTFHWIILYDAFWNFGWSLTQRFCYFSYLYGSLILKKLIGPEPARIIGSEQKFNRNRKVETLSR